MNLIKNYSALLLAIVLTLSACDKGNVMKNDVLTNIPKDVSMVTAVDLPSLMKKVDFDNVKTMEFYQEVIRNATEYNAVLGEIAMDPAKSGIDLSKSFYIANEVNPDNPEELFVAVVFSLKNDINFSKILESQTDQSITKGANYDLLVNRNQSVAWNDKIAVFGSTNSYNDITPIVSKFFSDDASASIATDKDLQKCLSGSHDISSWISSNAIAENEQVQMVLPIAGIPPDALKDNFIHSYLDFNDGEVVGHSSTFLNKGLTKDLKLLFKDEVNTDFTNYISSDGLNTMVTAALDFKGMKQVIAERPQGMAYLNFLLKEFGVSFDDIANTFGGDMLFTSNNDSKNTSGLFATDIKDQEGFQKFVDLAIEYEMIEKIGDNHYSVKTNSYNMYSPTGSGNMGAQITIKDDIMFMSNDVELISSIKDGTFDGNADKKMMKKVSGNVFGMYMDYQTIAKLMDDDALENITTMEFFAKRKNSDFALNFKDSNTNSLKQLFEMLNEQYVKAKVKETKQDKIEM